LAVGATEKVVVPDEKAAKDAANPYKVVQRMTVGLSCDHRVVDGGKKKKNKQKETEIK